MSKSSTVATVKKRSGKANDMAARETEVKLGSRIREMRQSRGLTLADLAARSSVSIGTLSQLERDLVSPTVRTLFTLSEALGISPAVLLDPALQSEKDSPFVVRAGGGQLLVSDSKLTKHLASPPTVSAIKAYRMVVRPGGNSGPDQYRHTGEETGYVVSGTLEIRIEDKVFVVTEGDCFAFKSHLPHRFHNPGEVDAVLFWVNAEV